MNLARQAVAYINIRLDKTFFFQDILKTVKDLSQ